MKQTRLIAQQIAHRLRQNNGGVVLLSAPMGAGKTTLAGEIVKILDPNAHPCSPTFTLINQYNDHLYHADLYRLWRDGMTAEQFNHAVESTGLMDLCGAGNYVLIEWPQSFTVPGAMRVTITVKEDGTREFVIAG